MNFMEVNGVKIHYRLDGREELPVLVLSNSLGSDLSMWNPQIEALTEHFRVLRYDTRGHGASDVPPGPYSIEQLGQEVVGLMDGLGIERAHFAGVSMGGMTGMWLAVNVPERFGKIALCNTAAYFGPRETWDQRIRAVRYEGMGAVAEGAIERWFTETYRDLGTEDVEQRRRVLLATSPEGYIATCEALAGRDLRDAIKNINLPTLVISGSYDLSTPPREGQYLAQQINGSRYVELPGAHLCNIELAQEFTKELTNFFVG
jgi:3-oxoadipate enol-lactonase